MKPVVIAGRQIGPGHPCFFIAEAGVNHNGELELACRLVDEAVKAGADAVKFQAYKAERLATRGAPKAEYQLRGTEMTESQMEMLRRLELSADALHTVMDYCGRRGILFLCTPFDEESADVLDRLGVAAYKLSSGEITNTPLLDHVARKMKPMIVSTGMATMGEVETALQTIQDAGNTDVVLLHCVSSYPANPRDANLRAMQTMGEAFSRPVGYSDHTLGLEVPLAAVALGASVIEKHFTLDRGLPGPDHQTSATPEELAALIAGIRKVEAALGHGKKEPAPSEAQIAAVVRKSLVAARDLPQGTTLTEELIAIKRPGTGLPPAMRGALVGHRLRVAVPADTLLSLDMLA